MPILLHHLLASEGYSAYLRRYKSLSTSQCTLNFRLKGEWGGGIGGPQCWTPPASNGGWVEPPPQSTTCVWGSRLTPPTRGRGGVRFHFSLFFLFKRLLRFSNVHAAVSQRRCEETSDVEENSAAVPGVSRYIAAPATPGHALDGCKCQSCRADHTAIIALLCTVSA